MTDYKYKAFISYSHADEKWARWLHRALESYRPPRRLVGRKTKVGVVPARMSPVFRDREELASSTDLGEELTAALEASACQIVICSMSAAKSHWVNEEILAFKRLGRSRRIFSLIVEGEPHASGMEGYEHYECFPNALRYRIGDDGELTDEPAEPIAADVRPGKDGKPHAKVKLVAGMLGLGFDDLRQREMQRRNRRLLMFSGFAIAGMVVAIGLATAAVIARNEAEAQRELAQREAETARRTADFMINLFQVSDPSVARGRSVTAMEILQAGVDKIEGDLEDQPEIQTSLMNTMGQVYIGLGLYPDAQNLLQLSLQQRRALASATPGEMHESLYNLAAVLTENAEFEQAEALYQEALSTLPATGEERERARVDSLAGLADLYFRTGQFEIAEPILREVLDARRSTLSPEDPAVADAIEELGMNMFDQVRYEEAESLVREALELRRRNLGTEPHPDLAENANNLGLLLLSLSRDEEAESLYREALEINRALYGQKHPDIAIALNNLAELYRHRGELQQAEQLYLQASDILVDLYGEDHPDVAMVTNNLALTYYYDGNLAAALESIARTIAILNHVFEGDHPNLALSYSTMGRWLLEAGRYEEAESALRNALDQQLELLDSEHEETAITRMALAELLAGQGAQEEALLQVEASESALVNTLGQDHWLTAVAENIRGSILGAQGRRDEAEAVLLDSYQRLAVDDDARQVWVAQCLKRVVAHYRMTGEHDAETKYQAIYDRDFGLE